MNYEQLRSQEKVKNKKAMSDEQLKSWNTQ